jgi:UDP:flavonoid glycosyltransferase YjiC (YdhE family)
MHPLSPQPGLRLVLAAVGSRGDVQPLLALGQALRQRGHAVRIAAPPNFAHWIQSLGFDFCPLGQDMQQYLADNPTVLTGDVRRATPLLTRYFADALPLQLQQLLAMCADADALVWAGLALTAPSAAEHLGIAALGVLYSTCMVPSGLHPPPTVRWHGLPNWVNHALWWLHDRLAQRMVGTPLNLARGQVGLSAVDLHDHLLHGCDYAIAADETLFPADPAWPANLQRANFLFLNDPEPLDPELDAWLQDGAPPIYIGFGSMGGPATLRMGRLLLQAMQSSDRRCLIAAGWAGLQGPSLPSGWRSVAAAPHAALFPRLAAVVHHGGSGTTAQALRCAVPQVLLPLILDQYHHAHRLHLAGLTPAAVAMERIRAMQLRESIEAAVAWPLAPRKAAATRLQQSDGATQLAKQIETLCQPASSRP